MKLSDIVLLSLLQASLGLELQHIKKDWLDDVFSALAGPVSTTTSATQQATTTADGSFWNSFESVAAQESDLTTSTSEYPSFLLAYATLTQSAASSTDNEGFFNWLLGSALTTQSVSKTSTSTKTTSSSEEDDNSSSDFPDWLLSDLNKPLSKASSTKTSKSTNSHTTTKSDNSEESLLALISNAVPSDLRSALTGDTFSSGFPSALLAYGATKSASDLLDNTTNTQSLSETTRSSTTRSTTLGSSASSSSSSSSPSQSLSSTDTSTDSANKIQATASILLLLFIGLF